MIWTEEALGRLNALVKVKFTAISEGIPLKPGDLREQTAMVEKAWHNYCMGVGIKMNIIPDPSTETDPDLPPPGGAMFFSGNTVRIRNIWGDKYIDMSEEFAVRALTLGFLP